MVKDLDAELKMFKHLNRDIVFGLHIFISFLKATQALTHVSF